jgi:hypothetical protein
MSSEKPDFEIFNQAIQNKLQDNQWDTMMVKKIMLARKENNRKWIQFALIPGILLTATSIFYVTNGYGNKTTQVAKEMNSHKNSSRSTQNTSKNKVTQERNNNVKIHIMDVVFSKLE